MASSPPSKSMARTRNLELPEHLIPEILSWLPAKSLATCKCVCKDWHALIQDPHFLVTMHLHRSIPKLIDLQTKENLDPSSKEQRVPEDIQTVDRISGLLVQRFEPSMKLRVRNPLTGKILDLPHLPGYEVAKHRSSIRPFVSSGYHAPSRQHKLVVVYRLQPDLTERQCAVLTLGKDQDWREVSLPDSMKRSDHPDWENLIRTVSQHTVHFLSKQQLESGGSGMRMDVHSLDIGTERFHAHGIDILPNKLFANPIKVGFCSCDNAVALYEVVGDVARVLVLEDYKTGKWRKEEVHLKFLKEHPHWREDLVLRHALPHMMIFKLGENFIRYNPVVGNVVQLHLRQNKDGKVWPVVSASLVEFNGMREAASWDVYKPFSTLETEISNG